MSKGRPGECSRPAWNRGRVKHANLVAAWLLLSTVGIAGCQSLHPAAPDLTSQINASIPEVNAGLPKMLDNITRLDRVSAAPPSGVVYEHTLVNASLTPDQQKHVESDVRGADLADPGLRKMIDQGMTAHYIYRDQKGVKQFEFTVSAPNPHKT